MFAVLLLDGVIIISYRPPTIFRYLCAFGHNSQCKRQLVVSPGIRNISPIEAQL